MQESPMPDLSTFAITRRWPAEHPDRLQLYSLPTPNGIKVGVALEELGLPYEAHRVEFSTQDQMTPEFLSLNPNNKIPAILDPDGPGGQPLALFESGAILLYLAEKTGRLLPSDPALRWQAVQWLMFQMGGVGPMFGQLGWFHKFDGRHIEDKRGHERYRAEVARLLRVLEGRLTGRDWIADEFSVADIALVPWLNGLDFYGVKDIVGWSDLRAVPAWVDRFMARPGVQRGLTVPAAA
jgi:GSH-dependent disulfide-bond oxidoreductase